GGRALEGERREGGGGGGGRGSKGFGERLPRIGAADDISLGPGRALDRASEHERLDLVEQSLARHGQTAGEARWNLTEHDERRARGQRRDDLRDRRRNAGEIALATIVGRHVGRNIDEVTGGEIFDLAGKGGARGAATCELVEPRLDDRQAAGAGGAHPRPLGGGADDPR